MSEVENSDAQEENYDHLTHPPHVVKPDEHTLWPEIVKNLKEIYDPEIPVNIYDLGLIYDVDRKDGGDVYITMSLTAPGCPVAGEMPGQVAEAVAAAEGVGEVTVELVWDPAWTPDRMSEDAKLALDLGF